MTLISIIVPVYQGEGTLRELHRRVAAALDPEGLAFELILVEDCSRDGSWRLIQTLTQEDPRVRGFRFSRNFGQHTGITAGLDLARGAWAVVMDCDLQDRPEEIPVLYAKAQEGFDVVVARRGRRKDSWPKRAGSWAFYRCFNYLAGLKMDAEVGNFRIISRRVVEALRDMREQTRFFGGMVEWLGFPTAAIDVQHAPREVGQSTYTLSKLLRMGLNMVVAYSDKPLRLAIQMGFLISAAAMMGGAWIFYRALRYGSPVMGWPSMVVSLYFLGGIIISLLGILGLYLGKTFDEAKGRPLYVIADRAEAE
jgi:glycosyltransferase involved in cell wall biosynthesis